LVDGGAKKAEQILLPNAAAKKKTFLVSSNQKC